jgi:multicomponent Na+:H+ antiporter subunit F
VLSHRPTVVSDTWFGLALMGLLLFLTLMLAGAVVRVVRGPHLADRVVALDLVAFVSVCMIGTAAMLTEEGPLLDVALVLSLLAFLGTVAFARFLERTHGKGKP